MAQGWRYNEDVPDGVRKWMAFTLFLSVIVIFILPTVTLLPSALRSFLWAALFFSAIALAIGFWLKLRALVADAQMDLEEIPFVPPKLLRLQCVSRC